MELRELVYLLTMPRFRFWVFLFFTLGISLPRNSIRQNHVALVAETKSKKQLASCPELLPNCGFHHNKIRVLLKYGLITGYSALTDAPGKKESCQIGYF